MRGLRNIPARKIYLMPLVDEKEFISSQRIDIETASENFVAV